MRKNVSGSTTTTFWQTPCSLYAYCHTGKKGILSGYKVNMALPTNVSCMVSVTLAVVLFAVQQIFRQQISGTEYMTIAGGFLGSIIFILLLTFTSNLEQLLFHKGYQARLFPEVVCCLLFAMFASGMVHRVCVTTCLIFSLVALYYINRLSSAKYAPVVSTVPVGPSKKKK